MIEVKNIIFGTAKFFGDNPSNEEISKHIEESYFILEGDDVETIISDAIRDSDAVLDMMHDQIAEEVESVQDHAIDQVDNLVYDLGAELRSLNHTLKYGKTIDTEDFKDDLEKVLDFIQDLPETVKNLIKGE